MLRALAAMWFVLMAAAWTYGLGSFLPEMIEDGFPLWPATALVIIGVDVVALVIAYHIVTED